MLRLIFVSSIFLAIVLADDCVVTSYKDLPAALESCKDLTISGIKGTKGETMELNLKDGATLTIDGSIKFGEMEWDGPLMRITGKGITVQGLVGNKIDGDGSKFWDGQGYGGKVKPELIRIEATGGSIVKNLYVKNCARQCITVANSDDVTLKGINIDLLDGNKKGGAKDTDGFLIQSSNNIAIESANVQNQGYCINALSGSKFTFSNIFCSGGYGLSVEGDVSDVTFEDDTVAGALAAIHLGDGEISGVTFKNLHFTNLTTHGINVDESNGSIKNLVLDNVMGFVAPNAALGVNIKCASCSGWKWSGVNIIGANRNSCNYTPDGYSC